MDEELMRALCKTIEDVQVPMRDKYKMAALTGLLANSLIVTGIGVMPSEDAVVALAKLAAIMADATMEV